MGIDPLPDASEDVDAVLETAQPADVVLTTSCDDPDGLPVSKLIRDATKAPVSHGLVVLKNHCYADAALRRPAIRDDGRLQDLRRSVRIRSCYLMRHKAADAGDQAGFTAAVLTAARGYAANPYQGDFAVADMVKGLLLLLTQARGPDLVGSVPWLRRTLREVLGGGPKRMFCSEFVYRCFETAAEGNDAEQWRINCPDLLLDGWRSVLTDDPRLMAAMTVEPDTVIGMLAQEGRLDGLPIQVEGAGTETGVEETTMERVAETTMEQLKADTLELVSRLVGQGVTASFADFVTPRDILYSPVLRLIAWCGLRHDATLDDWECTS